MSTKLSAKDRQAVAFMPLDELAPHCRSLGLSILGKNNHLFLAEFAQRLDVPTDAVSINVLRENKDNSYSVWHWGSYSEERISRFRDIEGRWWNSGCQCNCFTIPSADDPTFEAMLNELFNKSIIITDTGHRVVEGKASAEWHEPTLYELSDKNFPVSLKDVLEGLDTLRPNDGARTLAIHGEVDPEFRTLFSHGLRADPETLSEFDFETRHPSIIFRFSVNDGQPRYLVFSAERNEPLEVLFGNSKKTAEALAKFKETQQRLARPIIEPNSRLSEQLRSYEARASAAKRAIRTGPPTDDNG